MQSDSKGIEAELFNNADSFFAKFQHLKKSVENYIVKCRGNKGKNKFRNILDRNSIISKVNFLQPPWHPTHIFRGKT